MNEYDYISWQNFSHWDTQVILGSKEVYYNFRVLWNPRGEYWEITIDTLDGDVIIQNRKLVLNVNLLQFSYNNPLTPDCALVPATDAPVDRITYNNMLDEVKLLHILRGA